MSKKYKENDIFEAIQQHKKMANDYQRKHDDICPECGAPKRVPMPHLQCTLNQPIWICIPPGSHIHIKCPVHGSHRIDGPPETWCDYDRGTTYV
jgi:hypothetical protein